METHWQFRTTLSLEFPRLENFVEALRTLGTWGWRDIRLRSLRPQVDGSVYDVDVTWVQAVPLGGEAAVAVEILDGLTKWVKRTGLNIQVGTLVAAEIPVYPSLPPYELN